MNNVSQDIVGLTAVAGTSYKKETKVLEPGSYVMVTCYRSAPDSNNPGFVRATVKNAAGVELVKPVNIDDYRSRDCEYLKSGIPIQFEGGQQVSVEVIATANFVADTLFDFTFVKLIDQC